MNQILNGTEITRSTVPPSNADRHIGWFSKARTVGYDFLTGPLTNAPAVSGVMKFQTKYKDHLHTLHWDI